MNTYKKIKIFFQSLKNLLAKKLESLHLNKDLDL